MTTARISRPPGPVGRALSYAGGVVFALSIGAFLWFYLFDLERRESTGPAGVALTINALLMAAFALHHSVFARTRMRVWIARVASPYLERTIYVWIASVSFALVCALWMAWGEPYWQARGTLRVALRALQGAGIIFTLWSALALDSLSLAGIRQLDHPLPPSGVERFDGALQHTGPYGVVRHPIYLGWLLIVWPAPAMTPAHLLFAALTTAYLIIATHYEERSLHETFGPAYAEYTRRVRSKMIPGVY
ncbi:MAG: isoprenylcysteine carboxylmethyltransferase family protein [Acidobacteriota bacterium]|nr:isoprenylcysteine carboxylmethyltransferase family protein [Acidobacteriota bacterium]